MSNPIAASLQLNVILDRVLRGFQRKMVPVLAFALVARDVILKGTDKVAVPYYPLDSVASKDFAGTYVFDSSTSTQSKDVTINKRKYKDMSMTSSEWNRQPALDPMRLLELMGEKLAEDVLADILTVVDPHSYATAFTGAASTFDSDDLADLGAVADAAYWPTIGRACTVRETYKANLAKDASIKNALNYGGTDSIRRGDIPQVNGFDFFSAPLIPTRNDAFAVTCLAATDVFTKVAHGLVAGDRVAFSALTGGAGITAGTPAAGTWYYVIASGLGADVFKVSATLGGATIDVTTDLTVGTLTRATNLVGYISYMSAILCAFSPIEPHPDVRAQMTAYERVTDPLTQITLEYRRWGSPDTDTAKAVIECNYGYAVGELAALKLMVSV